MLRDVPRPQPRFGPLGVARVRRLSRRPVIALCAYLVAAIALGALLAFPVYAALQRIADPAFDSVLHRVAALTLLVLLPFYLASGRAGAGSEHGASTGFARSASGTRPRSREPIVTRDALGFGCSARTFRRSFAAGFVLGALVAAPLIGAVLVLGVRARAAGEWSVLDVGTYAAEALVAALVIGLIEEAYFRGALTAPLRRLSCLIAIPIVSVVYAAVHFLGAPLPAEDLGWTSGFSSIAHSRPPLDAFFALFAAGLLLGALRHRFGHIGVCAGLHAGWVWLMKLNQEYTDVVPGSDWRFLEGAFGGTMGWLGLAWIALLGAGWYSWERRHIA